MKTSLDFILENWPILAPILYEIIARLWPTKWNISLFDKIWQIVNALIPNKRKPDGKEIGIVATESGKLKNPVLVDIKKHVLKVVLLLMLAGSANGQIWQNVKGIRFVNVTDSTTVFPISGSIFYNQQSQQLMAYDTAWYNLRQSGGGGSVTNVSGTAGRITSTGGNTPVINIDPLWIGQTNITTLGAISTGVWNATTIGFTNGGTGLTALGSALQYLRTNSGATAMEWATFPTIPVITFGAATRLPFMNGGGTDFTYSADLTYNTGSFTLSTGANVDLGISSIGGTVRNITAIGSSTNLGIVTQAKGNGNIEFRNTGGSFIFNDGVSFTLNSAGFTTPYANQTWKAGNATAGNNAGATLNILGSAGTGTQGGGAINIISGSAPGSGTPADVTITANNNGNFESGNVFLRAATYATPSVGSFVAALGDGHVQLQTVPGNGLLFEDGSFIFYNSSGDPMITSNDGISLTIDCAFAGDIIYTNLRTTCAGAITGTMYNNAGILSICP